MILFENVRAATSAIYANGMRSVLTTLGIVIGTAAVIAVVSVVQGFEQSITTELEGVGATYALVLPKPVSSESGAGTSRPTLTWDDGKDLARSISTIEAIAPAVMASQQLKYGDQHHITTVKGVTDIWPEVVQHFVDRGRFFSHIDLRRRRKVAVIGQTVVDELDLGRNPVGREIYVGRMPVTVIGVMEEKGRSLGQDSDDVVFVPFETSLGLVGVAAGEQVQLHIQVSDASVMESTRDEIREVLRRRHALAEGDPDDFRVHLQDELLESTQGILDGVTAVVAAIVGVSLLVGGIGIMNILLVSVTERTREIGLRKALGARRQDILMQFLVESVMLSLLGGVVGIVLGYAAGAGLGLLVPENLATTTYVPWWAVATAFGFCTFVGVFFGIYPAAKAARLDPIEALRFE